MQIFKHVFLATMFFELVSTISQDWLDQFSSTSAYIFSTRVAITPTTIVWKYLIFFIRTVPKCRKNVWESKLNLQSAVIFKFAILSFILVPAIAEDIHIKKPFEFFISDDQKPSNSGHHIAPLFWKVTTKWSTWVNFNLFVLKRIVNVIEIYISM